MTKQQRHTVVLGIGNELLGDEGVGVVAARKLESEDLPPGVEIVEGATGGFDLIFELEGYECAVIIDAADMGEPPGTVRSFTPDEVRDQGLANIASLHQVGLMDVLRVGALAGPMPSVRIVGVQPGKIAPGMQLSAEVSEAIPRVIAEVRRIIDALAQPKEVVLVDTQAKILVVDDDPDITESLKLVLEGAGYAVEQAFTPEEAFDKAGSWQPDLILLDVMMPDGTEGFQFVWKLRNECPEPLNQVPIMIVSAIHDTTSLRFYPDQKDDVYEAGEFLPVQRFLDKPTEPSVLLGAVKELLAGASE